MYQLEVSSCLRSDTVVALLENVPVGYKDALLPPKLIKLPKDCYIKFQAKQKTLQ